MKALVFYTETGNGFKSPAVSIARDLTSAGIDAEAVDFFKAIGGHGFDRFLINTWRMFLSNEFLFILLFFFSNTFLYHLESFWTPWFFGKRLRAYLKAQNPDFVVCTHFVGTYVLERVVPKMGNQAIPVYAYNSEVILFHNSYNNRKVNGYFVSTEVGRNQMIARGLNPKTTHLSGFPIDPKYRKAFGTKAHERAVLGLKDQFTLLLTFGGEGVGEWSLVKRIAETGLPVQVVAICGKNEALKGELEAYKAAHPELSMTVKGFTTNLQDYLYCSDLSAGKSGLNIVFESLFLKRPFLVLKAMANERHCARWIVEHGFGWWPKTTEDALNLLKGMLTSPTEGKPSYTQVLAQVEVPPCTFDLKEMISIMSTETTALMREKLRNAKALCFDLAGTLCDIPIGDRWDAVNIAGIRNVLASIGADKAFSPEETDTLVKAFIAEKVRLRKDAKVTLREYEIRGQVQEFLAAQAKVNSKLEGWLKTRNLTEADWKEVEFQFIRPELDITLPFEGAPKLLALLKGRYPLYLLSNNVSRVLVEKICEKTGLAGFFDKIIVSSEVGYRKPHEAFMRAVERETGYKARECLMIGDRLTQDIEMANRYGMLSIHMAMVDHEDNDGADHISATCKVHSLEEIGDLLVSP